ncbi:MAG: phosphoglycerate dehydrogenase [Deferribacterota bacterium]|nr:phosphoglycerate dehydrogenase [Deferribacterota bacterium]
MDKFKILITDHISEEGIKILESSKDVDVCIKSGIEASELKGIIGDYDAIITRSRTEITKDILANSGRLKIIGRAGVGLDNVDIEEASRKNIIVMNAPTGNTIAATELTIALILSAARKIPEAVNSVKKGEWDRKRFLGIQLYEKTLGIIGLGRIGSNLAIRARSFGMKIVAYDPYIKKENATSIGVTLLENLEELLSISDVVTIHTPLTNDTINMITKTEINKMKDGAILVNCARGKIINEDDLCEALVNKKLYAAALDVFSKEPPKNNRLLELENVVTTPHIGANTYEGQKGVAVIIAEQVLNALHGKAYANAVNLPFIKSLLPKIFQLYFELAEKMGKLMAQIIRGRIDEIRVKCVGKIFEEELDSQSDNHLLNYMPLTIASLKGFLEVIMTESVTYMNAPFFAKDRGITIYETKADKHERFTDIIFLLFKTDKEEKLVGGTVLNDEIPRIVVFDKFNLDIVPYGTYLYFRNYDRPGVIGSVGTILGKNNINIAGFGLSREKSGQAVAFVSVDNKLTNGVLEEILNIDGIIEAKIIEF